jgi:hypothetical protein
LYFPYTYMSVYTDLYNTHTQIYYIWKEKLKIPVTTVGNIFQYFQVIS